MCPPKPATHGCCDKPAPSAPRTPCSQMACCQPVVATAAPVLNHGSDLAAFVAPDRALIAPQASSFFVATFSDSGPPGHDVLSVSDRAPPAFLG